MQKVLVENNADGTTLITINRPERRNAICNETALLLQKAFVEFERSPAQRAAVITGAGNEAFSGGADTGHFPELWRCIPNLRFEANKPIVRPVVWRGGGWAQGRCEKRGRAQRALQEVKESEDAEEAWLAVKERRKADFKGH